MKNFSISTFINIVFILAFAFITMSFLLFVKLDQEKFERDKHQRYTLIANSFLSGFQFFPTQERLSELYTQFSVSPVTQRIDKLNIINNAKETMLQNTVFGSARVFKQNDEYYIYVQKLSYNILLKDLKAREYNRGIGLLIYLASLLVFFLLFILIKKKFRPLRELNKQIQQFSDGNTNIKLEFTTNDEIGKIAKNFNHALVNINNLTKSKNLFMRNMMHELKTPITKAMFIAETIPDDNSRIILQKAFKRMDSIIKELATVEKLTSNMNVLYKEKISFFELYTKTLNILLIDSTKVSSKINDFDCFVDISLFSIALKNLIDNAIKFSPNSHAIIKATKDSIEVISSGDELKYDLEYYTEPFSQEEKRKDGFGLGLYIVKTTVELHGYSLEYRYENGANHFIINLQKS